MKAMHLAIAGGAAWGLSMIASIPAQAGSKLENDVFATRPPAASADGMPACRMVKEYVDNLNAHQYAKLGAFFAADSIFLAPSGQVLHGPEHIGKFYTDILGKNPQEVIPVGFYGFENDCFVELAFKGISTTILAF